MALAKTNTTFAVEHSSGTQVEINRGTINNHVYIGQNEHVTPANNPDSRQEKLTPSNTIPYRRDPDYVERAVLDEVIQRSYAPASRIALVGLGGVGKSQLAIEYAHLKHDSDPRTWIFWVHAASEERFIDSFSNIAKHLHLPGCHDPHTDVLGLVSSWLSDGRNGKWALIVDNADDDRVLFQYNDNASGKLQPCPQLLADYIPQSSHGLILVTSRSRDTAYRLVGRDDDIISVGPMEENDALKLLQKKLRSSNNVNDLSELAKELDFIPLALTQASAYMNRQASRISVRDFTQTLRQSSPTQIRLLERDLGDPRRDIHSSNSIVLTLQISFEYLERTAPSAARLLAWMSLFDRQNIPESLLAKAHRKKNSLSAHSNMLEDDIGTLMALDLIRPNFSQKTFSMHRLVQISTWKWLETRQTLMRCHEHYVKVLFNKFSKDQVKSWQTRQELLPHVLMVAAFRVENPKHSLFRQILLHEATRDLVQLGQMQIARSLMRECVSSSEETFGEDSIYTLDAYEYWLENFESPVRWTEIENTQRKMLVYTTEKVGWNNSHTLCVMNRLGVTLLACGKTEEAMRLTNVSLEIHKAIQTTGEGTDVHDSKYLVSLANLLAQQNRHECARKLVMSQTAAKRETGSSDDCEEHFALFLNIVVQENDQEAQAVAEEALPILRKSLGDDHDLTLSCMGILANLLTTRNKFEAAERLLRTGSTTSAISFPKTRYTALCLLLLVKCLVTQSKHTEAMTICREALRQSTGVTYLRNFEVLGMAMLKHIATETGLDTQSTSDPVLSVANSDISGMLSEFRTKDLWLFELLSIP